MVNINPRDANFSNRPLESQSRAVGVDAHAFKPTRNYLPKEADGVTIASSHSRSSPPEQADGNTIAPCRSRSPCHPKEADGDTIASYLSRSGSPKEARTDVPVFMDPMDVDTIEVAPGKALIRARSGYPGQ